MWHFGTSFIFLVKMLENRRRKRRREKRKDLKDSTPISVEYWQPAPNILSALLKNIFFLHFLEKKIKQTIALLSKRGFKLSLSPCSIICNWIFELNKEEHAFPCQTAIWKSIHFPICKMDSQNTSVNIMISCLLKQDRKYEGELLADIRR